jgi:hypothetical protein
LTCFLLKWKMSYVIVYLEHKRGKNEANTSQPSSEDDRKPVIELHWSGYPSGSLKRVFFRLKANCTITTFTPFPRPQPFRRKSVSRLCIGNHPLFLLYVSSSEGRWNDVCSLKVDTTEITGSFETPGMCLDLGEFFHSWPHFLGNDWRLLG